MWSLGSSAHVFTKEECPAVASTAGDLAVIRDRNPQDKDKVKASNEKAMRDVMGQEDSLIKDEDDVRRFLSLIDQLYAHMEIQPKDAANQIYAVCMRKSGPALKQA